MAEELAQVHHMVAARRAERRGWTFGPPQNSDQKMRDYGRAVLRNIKNDRRRNLRQWVAPQSQNDEKAQSKDGPILPPPDGGEIAPDAPEWPASRRPDLCPENNASLNPEPPGEYAAVPHARRLNARALHKGVKHS